MLDVFFRMASASEIVAEAEMPCVNVAVSQRTCWINQAREVRYAGLEMCGTLVERKRCSDLMWI